MIELALIGMDTSSAVPRTPSGPALMRLIELALKWVRSMFLSVVIVKLSWPVGKDVMTSSADGETNWAVGAVVSTTNGVWALGLLGLDWLPLWSMTRARAT